MNSPSRTWIDYLLWLLLAIGLFGVTRVSYANLTGSPCPQVLSVPIGYVVLLSYTLMVMSVIIWHNGCRHYFFAIGWTIATAIALIGSIAEFASGGGVCPSTGSGAIPLCYISLSLLILILILFILGPYKRSGDISRARETA